LALALILSGLLSYGFFYLIEVIDDRVKSPDHVGSLLNQTLLGISPKVPNSLNILEKLKSANSDLSEAYASIQTNVKFSGPNGGPRVIQITSTKSGEGKSTTSLGLALRFQATGNKVLLVDADLRLPTFNVSGEPTVGLAGYLTSNVNISDVESETGTDDIKLVTSGRMVPNPADIIGTDRFDEFIAEARDKYDYVVIDSPPVLGLADAPTIGAKVDATILVVEAGRSRTKNVLTTIGRLSGSGSRLLGIIMSKVPTSRSGYYNYYQYQYGPTNGDTKGTKTKSAKAKVKLDLS